MTNMKGFLIQLFLRQYLPACFVLLLLFIRCLLLLMLHAHTVTQAFDKKYLKNEKHFVFLQAQRIHSKKDRLQNEKRRVALNHSTPLLRRLPSYMKRVPRAPTNPSVLKRRGQYRTRFQLSLLQFCYQKATACNTNHALTSSHTPQSLNSLHDVKHVPKTSNGTSPGNMQLQFQRQSCFKGEGYR